MVLGPLYETFLFGDLRSFVRMLTAWLTPIQQFKGFPFEFSPLQYPFVEFQEPRSHRQLRESPGSGFGLTYE